MRSQPSSSSRADIFNACTLLLRSSSSIVVFSDHPDPDEDDIERLACLLIDWIFAGVSTTSEQALWVLLFLMKHPDQMKVVQAELRNAMKDGKGMVARYSSRSLYVGLIFEQFTLSNRDKSKLLCIGRLWLYHFRFIPRQVTFPCRLTREWKLYKKSKFYIYSCKKKFSWGRTISCCLGIFANNHQFFYDAMIAHSALGSKSHKSRLLVDWLQISGESGKKDRRMA